MPNRWNDVMALFEAVLEQPSGERTAWLAASCDDSALRAEVEHLLAAHEHSDGILDEPLYPLPAAASEGKVERHIGPYRTVRLLGHGGMGSVYLAERADGQFDQQVALKLLRMGFASDDHIERFLAERQILATLHHPNIARLLDGGVTEEDQPYFVMELVEGEPLDRYCDAHRLSIRERIQLFLDVCEAAQYAHRSLVVHRDLKPSNVLVTEEGQVKLLDFGIAKLLDAEAVLGRAAPLTRTGLLPMTPSYASPEQVRGETVTTASDVYQLGVILYELLTGHRPYRLHDRTPSQIERIVCEEEPTRPSTVVTQDPLLDEEDSVTPEQIGEARKTEPERLQKKLRGDLDTIVMKALRKEPERRYDSAQELADDLVRYLSDRPVTAREDTLRYRTGKFVRRNRWGVAVAALIALLVAGYAVTITVQTQRVQDALTQAQREAEKSEQATDFLVSMFERANPYKTEGPAAMYSDTLTTRELLDRGAARVRRELAGQPEVQATMMHTLGRIYRQHGGYDEAESLLEEALALQRKHLPPTDLERAESLHELARLLRHKGETDRAARLYREALDIQRAKLGDAAHPGVAENLSELGIIAAREGAHERADSLFREALAMRRALHGPDHPDVATGLHLLALLHVIKEELTVAERMLRRSLAIRRNHVDADHPEVAETLDRLGQVLVMQGRLDEAEPLLREAMAIREELFQEVHPSRAVSLNNMGRLLREKGDYEAAARLHREAQAIYQTMYGEENMDAATTLFERGRVQQARGDYAAAETLYQRAAAMQESVHGPDHPDTRRYLEQLAGLRAAWGTPGEETVPQAPSAADENRP